MTAIVVVSSDEARRTALLDALRRRFGADYDVVATAGAAATERSVTSWGPVAVAIAPIGTADFDLLQAIRAAHPSVRRIAVVDVGDTTVAEKLRRAMTLSHVDYYVGQPWASPEEELYPVVSEALRIWAHDQQLLFSKVTIVSEPGNAHGQRLATLLDRNGIAARVLTPTSAEGAALRDGDLAGLELPAVQLWDGRVLASPGEADLAEALGGNTRPTREMYDLAIVGAGPAGLATAIYAASDGLRTMVIESTALGGQAGTSSKIRNYLGFQWGLRGQDLAVQASRQAEQLGAEFIVVRTATGLGADGSTRVVSLSSGDAVGASRVVIAGGVAYRRTGVPSLDALVGHGVFYGASASDAAAMRGLRVAVLGGGNSAGQAAAHLAAAGAAVTVLVRGDSVTRSMSDYLVQQLQGTPNVTIRTGVQVTEALGDGQLSALVLDASEGGKQTVLEADALFVFIGARPHTEWLAGAVDLDEHGYVLTGRNGASWLETSMPGVYAAGDIRAGSIKRVAAAVGEGSTAAMLVGESLARPGEGHALG